MLPPVSHCPSRKEWEMACWKKIVNSKELVELLITPSERHNLVMRAAVADRIISGKKYRQIADELWLSPQTISGIKKAINERAYRSYWVRSKTERKKKIYSYHATKNKRRSFGKSSGISLADLTRPNRKH